MVLKEAFGAEQKLFDADRLRIAGCKVAVTATTISDATAFVFSNYNGRERRSKACGMPYQCSAEKGNQWCLRV